MKKIFQKTMKHIGLLFIILILLTQYTKKAFPEESFNSIVKLKPVIVKSNKKKQTSYCGQSSFTITSEEIQKSSAGSVEEILMHKTGIDIKRRSTSAVQSDVNIRGSNFQQVLILIDGIRINDPQTAHHNMDIPLTLEDIDEIKVTKTSSSHIYGDSAISGVVNIKTKDPSSEQKINISSSIGSYSLSGQSVTWHLPLKKTRNIFSFERKEASAYKPETEFNIRTGFCKSVMDVSGGQISYSLAYTDKDFGAGSFYSSSYPAEEEHTNTKFFTTEGKFTYFNFLINPELFYKRHYDKFILDRHQPSIYTNQHTSYLYGSRVKMFTNTPCGDFTAGFETSREKITSTQIENHSRENYAIFLNSSYKPESIFQAEYGLRADYYNQYGWQISPGINLSCFLNPSLETFISASKGFRIPSFTELYYNSPANIGDSGLETEKSLSTEWGIHHQGEKNDCSFILFHRRINNAIDWVRTLDSEPWEAENIGSMNVKGFEISSGYNDKKIINLDINRINISYAYTNSDKDLDGLSSKYALNYLKHHITVLSDIKLPLNFNLFTSCSYKQRQNQSSYFLTNAKLSKKKLCKHFEIEYFLTANNLFNTSYCETAGNSMPGRWMELGVKFEF